MVNLGVDGYTKAPKSPENTPKNANNNLLKTKRILKPKCKLNGGPLLNLACRVDDSSLCPPSVTATGHRPSVCLLMSHIQRLRNPDIEHVANRVDWSTYV